MSSLRTSLQHRPFVEEDNLDKKGQVIGFSYFHIQSGELKRLINEASAENLPKDGSEPMTGNLDVGIITK